MAAMLRAARPMLFSDDLGRLDAQVGTVAQDNLLLAIGTDGSGGMYRPTGQLPDLAGSCGLRSEDPVQLSDGATVLHTATSSNRLAGVQEPRRQSPATREGPSVALLAV